MIFGIEKPTKTTQRWNLELFLFLLLSPSLDHVENPFRVPGETAWREGGGRGGVGVGKAVSSIYITFPLLFTSRVDGFEQVARGFATERTAPGLPEVPNWDCYGSVSNPENSFDFI